MQLVLLLMVGAAAVAVAAGELRRRQQQRQQQKLQWMLGTAAAAMQLLVVYAFQATALRRYADPRWHCAVIESGAECIAIHNDRWLTSACLCSFYAGAFGLRPCACTCALSILLY
jgi:hypothetical protein